MGELGNALQMKIASTGPPPRGGGNRKRKSAKKKPQELQRGRPRAGAEIALFYFGQIVAGVLQRGRPRAGAEINRGLHGC